MLRLVTYKSNDKTQKIVISARNNKEIKSYVQRTIVDPKLKIESIETFGDVNHMPEHLVTYLVQSEHGDPLNGFYTLKDAVTYLRKTVPGKLNVKDLVEVNHDDAGIKIPSGWMATVNGKKFRIRELAIVR